MSAPPMASASSTPPDPAVYTLRVNRRAFRLGLLAAVGAFLLWAASRLADIVNPLLLALLIAYVLNPSVEFLERRHIRRAVTVFGVYVLLLGLMAVAAILLVPSALSEGADFYRALALGDAFTDLNADKAWEPGEPLLRDLDADGAYDPSYFERMRVKVRGWLDAWNSGHPSAQVRFDELFEKLRETLEKNAKTIAEKGLDVTGSLFALLSSGLAGLFMVANYALLVPLYVWFFLTEMRDMKARVSEYLPGAYRDDLLRIGGQIDLAVSSFFRGKITVCLCKGLATFLGLWLCGVRFPLVFGLLSAFGSVVPFLVAVVAFLPALVVSYLDHGLSWTHLIGVAVTFGAAEAVEAVLTPLVLGKEVGLHPVTLIVALFVGGAVLGFLGVLLAVPLAAIVKILAVEFLLPHLHALAQERKETA